MRESYPWLDANVLAGQPTVGAMLDLCEENYRFLLCLIPGVRQRGPGEYASMNLGAELQIIVCEQTPYTTTLRLTYLFDAGDEGDARVRADPDACIRLYHDACQIEVLELRQHALPVVAGYKAPALVNKWRLNLFLSKWLGYCWRRGYCFEPAAFVLFDENCV